MEKRQYRDKFFSPEKANEATDFAAKKTADGWRVVSKVQANGSTWVYFSKGFNHSPETDPMLGLLAAGQAVKAAAMMIGFFGPSEQRNSELSGAIGKWDDVAEPLTDKSER